MVVEKNSTEEEQKAQTPQRSLLIVCPKPPPIGGATVTVQAFLDELEKISSVRATIINSSPPPEYVSAKKSVLNVEKIKRMVSILNQYIKNIKHHDAILVFASNQSGFFTFYVPLLLLLARWSKKPFYLKPFGGALDMYLAAQKKPIRSYLIKILRSVDGILAQTRQLQAALIDLGCTKTYYVPGCRSVPKTPKQKRNGSGELRLVFVSLIYRKKGVMILLDALELLAQENNLKIMCDFYGPILEDREEFLSRIEATTYAQYCGAVEPENSTSLIAKYDVLVLPTFAPTEGHPGAIIEAMQAGVPVISTQLRTIPELITHGENGFLVPLQDSRALADAIKQMAVNPSMRMKMGVENYRRGEEFRSDVVVPKVINIIFKQEEQV